jgi:hypothetical protein
MRYLGSPALAQWRSSSSVAMLNNLSQYSRPRSPTRFRISSAPLRGKPVSYQTRMHTFRSDKRRCDFRVVGVVPNLMRECELRCVFPKRWKYFSVANDDLNLTALAGSTY